MQTQDSDPADKCKAKKELKLEEVKIEDGNLILHATHLCLILSGLLYFLGQTVAQAKFTEK